MTVTVSVQNEEQEKILIDFLTRMQYEYQSEFDGFNLTDEQKQKILRRDNDFILGKTAARTWQDIKRDLDNVYR